MELKEAIDLFLNHYENEGTRKSADGILRPFMEAMGAIHPVDEIRPIDLERYVQYLRTRKVKYSNHPRRPAVAEGLSARTVSKHVMTIKTFFKWLI